VDLPNQAVIELLTYLLPGFIAAAILYSLTPSPRPAPFERIVQALIFTIIVQAFVLVIRSSLLWAHRLVDLGAWSEGVGLVWSVSVAALLGLLLARLSNHDDAHKLLRWLRITQQTSYSSEWYGALSQNKGFVVLHLSGERRLFGWPEEWPSTPGRGHFVITQPEWLDNQKSIPLRGVERILIRIADVEMVELMADVDPTPKEGQNGRA